MAANPTGVIFTQHPNHGTVSWNAVAGVQGYRIRYRVVNTINWVYPPISSPSVTEYDIYGLIAFAVYQFQVRSIPADNWPTTFVSGTINYQLSEPQLTGAGVVDGIRISWSVVDSNHVDYYQIARRGPGAGNQFAIIQDRYFATSYTDTEVEFDTAYDYRVSAINLGDNFADAASQILAGIKAKYQLPKPALLNTSSVFSGASVTLNWQAYSSTISPHINRYSLYRDNRSVSDSISAGAVTYTDTGLDSSVYYEYSLVARGQNIYVDSKPAHWITCPPEVLASASDGAFPFVLGSEQLDSVVIPATATASTDVSYTNPEQYKYTAPPSPLIAPQPIITEDGWNAMCDNLTAMGGNTNTKSLRGTIPHIFNISASTALGDCSNFVAAAWHEVDDATYGSIHKITNHLYYIELSLVKSLEEVPTFHKEILCNIPDDMAPNKDLYFTLQDFYSNDISFRLAGNQIEILHTVFPPFRLHKNGFVWGSIN